MGNPTSYTDKIARNSLAVGMSVLGIACASSGFAASICLGIREEACSFVESDCPGPGCPSTRVLYTQNPYSEAGGTEAIKFAVEDCQKFHEASTIRKTIVVVVDGPGSGGNDPEQERSIALETASNFRAEIAEQCNIELEKVYAVAYDPMAMSIPSSPRAIVYDDPTLVSAIDALKLLMF